MENLIELSSSWLRGEDCLQGDIQDRTMAIITKFQNYVNKNKDELESITGTSFEEILSSINSCRTDISNILKAFLKGDQFSALKYTRNLVKNMRTIKIQKGLRLYKARKGESLYLFSENEMFHIPFDHRDLIGNQRYSISGIPCLYLGSSSYICWEELGRVDFDMCNYCGYTNALPIMVFDLSLPLSISSLADIKRVCIILACSLSAKRDALFKEEYILPQNIFQVLILRRHYKHKGFCIRYISTHLLNGDADCFKCNFSKEEIERYINYVFPAAESQKAGYSNSLKSFFSRTNTIAMFREKLLSLNRLIEGNNDDAYLNSQFGLMDALLDEKMGLSPIRKETKYLTI
ncbi:MAG: hypothetical protein IKZ50_01480 [Bacteroidales bacterium]|nr:hypothetical protein [Bacteroidales bacterium]